MLLALILQLAIVAPVSPRDTAGHVDLKIGQTITLAVNQPIAIKWSSGNPTVASVSTKGVVTAKARGYATITAATATARTTIRACVTDVDVELLTPKQIAASVVTKHEPRIRQGYGTQMIARARFRTSPDWGSCTHWFVDDRTARFASIDRGGLLTAIQQTHADTFAVVGAAIGPRIP